MIAADEDYFALGPSGDDNSTHTQMLNADVAVAFVDGPYGQVSSDLSTQTINTKAFFWDIHICFILNNNTYTYSIYISYILVYSTIHPCLGAVYVATDICTNSLILFYRCFVYLLNVNN